MFSRRYRKGASERGWLLQATEGPPPEDPPMPRLADTKARRPHSVIYQRASQDRFRERSDDDAQTKSIVRWLRGTHGRRASVEEGGVWGDARG